MFKIIKEWIYSFKPTQEQNKFLNTLSNIDDTQLHMELFEKMLNKSSLIKEYKIFNSSFIAKDIFNNEISFFKKKSQFILVIGMEQFRGKKIGNLFWKLKSYLKGLEVEHNKKVFLDMHSSFIDIFSKNNITIRNKNYLAFKNNVLSIDMVDVGSIKIVNNSKIIVSLINKIPEKIQSEIMNNIKIFLSKMLNINIKESKVTFRRYNVLGYDMDKLNENHKKEVKIFMDKFRFYYDLLLKVEDIKKMIKDNFKNLSENKLEKLKNMIYSEFKNYDFAIKELMGVYNNELSKRKSTI